MPRGAAGKPAPMTDKETRDKGLPQLAKAILLCLREKIGTRKVARRVVSGLSMRRAMNALFSACKAARRCVTLGL
jgi:hypothetical protein